MTAENKEESIELRVEKIAQLFHTLDPLPFRERDLDREAEDYIVGWAREFPADQKIRIVIHFPDSLLPIIVTVNLASVLGASLFLPFLPMAAGPRVDQQPALRFLPDRNSDRQRRRRLSDVTAALGHR
jgi:hypothetical protein